MREAKCYIAAAHRPLLDYELRQALNTDGKEVFIGLSTYSPELPYSFWFDDSATDYDLAELKKVIEAHNPNAELPDHLKPVPSLEEKLEAALKRIEQLEKRQNK